ncbi:hypothetical protein PR048_019501 [Dryococelus australis]|uniref:Uncharacterized protein n=1 Tax=Dryococelus australis TaxID=614101 RepID=A0ABQ9H3M0_9NEOP|nr:hypothetical protein PR048_019501 [Dryococelus australis]
MNRAISLFLLNVIPTFENVNIIGFILRDILFDLLKQLLSKFVKPTVIKNSDVLEASQIFNELKETDTKTFYESVRTYFCTSSDYIVCVANINKTENSKFSNVEYFLRIIKEVDGELKCDRLARVIFPIITIPHGNVECKRVFSVIKNWTQFRSLLSNDSLECLPLIKSRLFCEGSSVMAPTPSSLFRADIRVSTPWMKVGSSCQGANLSPFSKIVSRSWVTYRNSSAGHPSDGGESPRSGLTSEMLPRSDAFHSSHIRSQQTPAVRFSTFCMFQYLEMPLPAFIPLCKRCPLREQQVTGSCQTITDSLNWVVHTSQNTTRLADHPYCGNSAQRHLVHTHDGELGNTRGGGSGGGVFLRLEAELAIARSGTVVSLLGGGSSGTIDLFARPDEEDEKSRSISAASWDDVSTDIILFGGSTAKGLNFFTSSICFATDGNFVLLLSKVFPGSTNDRAVLEVSSLELAWDSSFICKMRDDSVFALEADNSSGSAETSVTGTMLMTGMMVLLALCDDSRLTSSGLFPLDTNGEDVLEDDSPITDPLPVECVDGASNLKLSCSSRRVSGLDFLPSVPLELNTLFSLSLLFFGLDLSRLLVSLLLTIFGEPVDFEDVFDMMLGIGEPLDFEDGIFDEDPLDFPVPLETPLGDFCCTTW